MSAQKPDAVAIFNPWRAQIENILAGTNYLRGTEWQELLEELDGLYTKTARITALEAQSAELVEALKGVLNTRVAEVKAATAYRVAYDNFGNANREAGAHMRAMTAASNAEKKARAVIEKSTGSA